jgi:chromosome segregation ATPase
MVRQEIAQRTGRSVAESASETRAAWSRLEQGRQDIAMELVGKRARQEALVKAMKEVSNDLSAKATKDAVAEELEKVVKAREHAVEIARGLSAVGKASNQEVLDVEGKLAEAKARVLERRDLVAERSGGTIMVDLNRELQSVTVAVAEAEAKLAAAEKILHNFSDVSGLLEELQQMESERDSLIQSAAKARDALADVLQQIPEPRLTILPEANQDAGRK